ncbi:MAG TPA: DNA gyrase inhibitor YacG [Terriglobales bacterium]|nr:DNA gyrase inhibitor YacG [Terriglobales bacterium]
MKCPICRQPVAEGEPEYPFCSQRCRVADLANWAQGVYRVPVKPTDEAGNDPGIPESGPERPQ